MIAALPNGGKTYLALYWVTRLVEREGMTALYFSADSDEMTVKKRVLSMMTGDDSDDIEHRLLTGKGRDYNDLLDEKLAGLSFSFETDPTFDYMAEEIRAFAEKWGDYPDVIVIDNLLNVISETADEYVGMRNITKATHRMARQTTAAVFILHHINEGSGDPAYPPPRRNITGKVNQLAELILTLGFDSAPSRRLDSYLRVAAVKNRSGPHDATGRTYTELIVDVPVGAIYEDRFAKEMERVA